MFVCVCNGHRDSEIRQAAQAGLTCARQIYRHLGKPVRCGRCLEFAAGIIAEAQAPLGSTTNARDTAEAVAG